MSRTFDGFGDDSITLSPGACASIAGGPLSVVFLHRPASGFCGMIHGEKTGSSQWEIWGEGSNYFTLPGGFSAGPAPVSATWQLIGYSKASGTSTPRYHKVDLEGGSAGVWAHSDGSATTPDGTGPLDAIVLGHGSVRHGNGLWAAAAVFDTVLDDAAWEALGFVAAQDWFNAGPAGMWLGNQASTSDPVLDVTAGGADQTATTNPAVSASEPPGWDYAVQTAITGTASLPLGALALTATGVRTVLGVAVVPLGALSLSGFAGSVGAGRPYASASTGLWLTDEAASPRIVSSTKGGRL